ncbi:MAG: NUDIX hydrolase [Candidatus Paceibacterota bacterium]|jgi:8-oxo-dGTP pyrophosphatase MutT (NUDIX family)
MSKKEHKDWSVILLQETLQGVVCIRKPPGKNGHNGDARYWQFPGGKRAKGELRPKQTVVRENREETGIYLCFPQIYFVGCDLQHNHYTHNPFSLYFYRTTICSAQAKNLVPFSNGGEEVRIFEWDELFGMDDFSPFHQSLARKYGVWRKRTWRAVK